MCLPLFVRRFLPVFVETLLLRSTIRNFYNRGITQVISNEEKNYFFLFLCNHYSVGWYVCLLVFKSVFLLLSHFIIIPSGADSGGGAVRVAPPLDFQNLKRKRALSFTTAIEKETKRKKDEEKRRISFLDLWWLGYFFFFLSSMQPSLCRLVCLSVCL